MWMLSSDAIVLRYSAGAIPGMVLVLGLAWWMGMRMVSRRVGADATLRRTRSAAVGDRADPVNVNEASTEELARVRYVGSSLAARMVAHREEHGPFRSEADLIAVDGIGPRSVKRLLPGLRFGAPEPDGRDSLAETGATSGVPIGTPASTGRTFAIVVIGWAVSAAAGGQIIGLCIAFGVTAWFLAKAQGGRSALRVPARRTSFAVWLGALAVGGSLFGAVGAGWYSGHLVDMRFGAARAAALSWPDLAQPWVMGQAALLLLAWMAALLLARRAPAGPTP
jgi:competence ComEA-like helix-hairpin-helix protein